MKELLYEVMLSAIILLLFFAIFRLISSNSGRVYLARKRNGEISGLCLKINSGKKLSDSEKAELEALLSEGLIEKNKSGIYVPSDKAIIDAMDSKSLKS